MFSYNDLYNNTFLKYGILSTKVDIISGYASPVFLERVINDFPNLRITLFIGMTDEGVSVNNHLRYKKLQEQHNVEIYYQSHKINGLRPTHIKAYRFFNDAFLKTIIGSANFTENGFFHNRELLVEVNDEFNEVFNVQRANSILCSAPNLTSYIKFVTNKEEDSKNASSGNADNYENDLDRAVRVGDQGEGNFELRRYISQYFNSLGRTRVTKYHSFFKVQIALNSESNSRWYETGINGKLSSNESVLKHSDSGRMYDLFPENEKITLYTEDNQILYAELTGIFNREIKLIGTTWYEYVINRLGIDFGVPLSNENLIQLRLSQFEFERINENEYFMRLTN